jgi:hypothetical protein
LSIAGDAFTLVDSILTGRPRPKVTIAPETDWRAHSNTYDIQTLAVGDTAYTHEQFADYRTATGRDEGSIWVDTAFGETIPGQQ